MPTQSEDVPSFTSHSTDPESENRPASDQLNGNVSSEPSEWPDIPGYKITSEIARSATACVCRALDRSLGKEVALRILHALHVGTDTAAQFAQSARIAAQIQHPGVPPVFEVGTLPDGRHYQAMKLVQGKCLAILLSEGTNPVTDRIRFLAVFEKLCQTIAYVHTEGVIHRDLSPQHVLIDNFGDVQVLGWGSALGLRNKVSGSTEETACLWSRASAPAYMPPEQARGEWDKLTCRTDVFALGGILVEILTGRPAYTGHSSAEVLKKAVAGDLAEAFHRLDYCGEDADLVAIAKRCLKPDPALRPADAGELASMISAFRNSIEEKVRKSEAERLAASLVEAEKGKRRQLQAALVFVVGMFIIWTGALMWWQSRQASMKHELEGTRKPDEKLSQQAERERAARADAERRIRELKSRSTPTQEQVRQKQEQARQQLLEQARQQKIKMEQIEKEKRNTPKLPVAPPPREVKGSEP